MVFALRVMRGRLRGSETVSVDLSELAGANCPRQRQRR